MNDKPSRVIARIDSRVSTVKEKFLAIKSQCADKHGHTKPICAAYYEYWCQTSPHTVLSEEIERSSLQVDWRLRFQWRVTGMWGFISSQALGDR